MDNVAANLVLHIPLGNVLFQKYSFFYINLLIHNLLLFI